MATPTDESYEAVQSAYDYFNTTLFEGKLPTCLITFQRQKRIMGYVSFKRWVNTQQQYVDELAINPEYFANYPPIEICQTLCHEMVHIWQAHFGTPGRRGYHNAQWAKKMTSIGLIPSTTSKPGGDATGEHVGDYILRGGLFYKACQTFLDQGFSLRWVDRFPVHRGDAPVITYDEDGRSIKLEAAEEKPMAMPKFNTLQLHAVPTSVDEAVVRQDETPHVFAAAPSTPTLVSSQPLNRSNRHKYVCKGCAMQLWGKPGLHVICGTCQLGLTEYS
jgi:predicted SprT family Zn-dependent metalloprotease